MTVFLLCVIGTSLALGDDLKILHRVQEIKTGVNMIIQQDSRKKGTFK